MNIKEYIQELCNDIDAVRRNLWGTDEMQGLRQPVDTWGYIHDRQSKRAEIWQGIIDYREERIEFPELLMFLQSFDRKVTPDDVYTILGDSYHG